MQKQRMLQVCPGIIFRTRPNTPRFLLFCVLVSLGLCSSGCVGLTGAPSQSQIPGTLAVSPSTIAFGDVEVGTSSTQTLTVNNSGTGSLTITQATVNNPSFVLTGQAFPLTLAAGQSGGLTLQFAPASTTSATGSVSLVSNASNSPTQIAVNGKGVQRQLSATPNSASFGNVTVGASTSQAITLTNSGTANIGISQCTVSGAGFSINSLVLPITLGPGQSTILTSQFSPTAVGAVSGSISVSSNAHNSPTTISLSGTGTQGALSASPANVTFGNILVGNSGSALVTLNNSGTSAITISQAAVSGAGFSISGLGAPMTVNAGQSTSLTATFSPATTGNATGAISISSNAPGSPLIIPVAGNGIQPQLAATPSSTSFGTVVTGTSSSQSIKLANGGTAPVTISQAGVTGAGFSISGISVPLTIATGGSATFNAVFAPTAAGSVAGAASLVSNAPNSPLAISLSGTGVAPTLLLSANPSSLSFGALNIGASTTLTATVTNGGNANVTITGVNTTGAGFSATNVSPGMVLSPNQSATLNVTFAPQSAGTVTGSVSVTSNATNSPTVINLSGSGVQQTAAFPVWVASSLARVGRSDAPGTTSAISLSGARGETVDAQVIVQAPVSGLTNVNVSASSLSGPGGASIAASNIALYREYYISVTGTASYGGGNNPPLGSGTYPEPLIPFSDPETGAALCSSSAVLKACNASVTTGQNQPYWIDISIPHGSATVPPGTYTGTISVTADQGAVSIPVTLTIWNFGLPTQPSELSLWTLWPPASGNSTATLAQALMRNKVMSWYDVAANAASDIANFGLNRSGLDGYYFIGIQCNGSYSSLPSTSQINAAAANFPAGLGLDFYVADELNGCTADYTAVKTMGLNAHAANRSVKTMMTLNAPDPNLYNEGDGRSAIDHWVLLDSVQQWPGLPFSGGGSDLWSYTSCNTGFGNAPEWMVDYPPINERIQAGFLNWTQGATGVLYYRADGWTGGNTLSSWNNVDTTACGGGLGRPGDGIFLYPPGPIASSESAPGIRLKAIRDGIQDYEYAHILTSLGQTSFLNSVVVPIATSWTNWNHSTTALENARSQLGQQLNLLAPPGF